MKDDRLIQTVLLGVSDDTRRRDGRQRQWLDDIEGWTDMSIAQLVRLTEERLKGVGRSDETHRRQQRAIPGPWRSSQVKNKAFAMKNTWTNYQLTLHAKDQSAYIRYIAKPTCMYTQRSYIAIHM